MRHYIYLRTPGRSASPTRPLLTAANDLEWRRLLHRRPLGGEGGGGQQRQQGGAEEEGAHGGGLRGQRGVGGNYVARNGAFVRQARQAQRWWAPHLLVEAGQRRRRQRRQRRGAQGEHRACRRA